MYKKGTGNDKQGKDAGNRTLCPYRNFSRAIRQKIARVAGIRSLKKIFPEVAGGGGGADVPIWN